MEPNTHKKESLEDQLKSLTEKLNFEQKTVFELRNFINVMRDGWSSDKAKLLATTEKLNEAENKLTHTEKNNQLQLKREVNKPFDEQKTVRELHNFIGVMKEGWSLDKAKLLEATEKLNKAEEELKQKEKYYEDNLTRLEQELNCERKTVGDLHNFIDMRKSATSLDKEKLSLSEELDQRKLDQCSFVEIDSPGKNKMLPNKKCDDDKNITISSKSKNKCNESYKITKNMPTLDHDPLRITEEAHISCPLCWNGSLPSLKNLKCMLLSILNNVLCPLCYQICGDIRSLVNHLEIGCGNNGVPEIFNSEVQDINDNQFEASYTVVDINKIKLEKKEPLIQDIKEEDIIFCDEVVQGESNDASSTTHSYSLLKSSHNGEGYWVKRRNVYNFVNNEEKMRMLDASFIRPKYKINTSVSTKNKLYSKKYTLKLINKLEPVDGVANTTLSRRGALIYIVDEQNSTSTLKVKPLPSLLEQNSEEKESEIENKLEKNNSKTETDKLLREIQILKISLANDKEITIENVDFDCLPSVPENIVPFLERVNNPQIPLFEGAMMLKWKCMLCLSIFGRVYSAIKHNCYKCKYCGNGFRKNIVVFTHHQLECGKKKANDSAKPFACSNCPSFFKTLEEAQSHMPAHYSGSTAVQCHLCYCLFFNKAVLNEHLSEEHNTDPSQHDSSVKRRRYMPQNKFRHNVLSTEPSTFSENDTMKKSVPENRCNNDMNHSNKTDEPLSEVQVRDTDIKDLTPLRSQRKRKANKIYSDQFLLY